jgi:hypothetical protein
VRGTCSSSQRQITQRIITDKVHVMTQAFIFGVFLTLYFLWVIHRPERKFTQRKKD